MERMIFITDKPFLTIDEQIKRLKSLGISIDKSTAKNILSENSYFSIINGYKDPFLFLGQKDKFIKGTTFKEIFSLYDFDKRLSYTLLPVLLNIETTIKTEIIYNFLLEANKISLASNDIYLRIDSYDNTPKKIKATTELIADFQKTISSHFAKSPSISHYIVNYGSVPLWVLRNFLSFGQMSKFYSCLKPSVRQSISKKYHMTDSDFETFLKLLAKTRNQCAHGNRLYCSTFLPIPTISNEHYPLSSTIQSSLEQHNKFVNLLLVIKTFISHSDYKSLINQISSLFKTLEAKLITISLDSIRKSMGLPQNWEDLKNKA